MKLKTIVGLLACISFAYTQAAPQTESAQAAAPQTESTQAAENKTADNECAVVITANMLKFDTDRIVVKKHCETFKITLKNEGTAPKTSMGHNVVVTRAADAKAVAQAGLSAGVAKDYVPENDKRILFKTAMIGGGESATVDFPTRLLSADEAYQFFCTFPAHFYSMQGKLELVD